MVKSHESARSRIIKKIGVFVYNKRYIVIAVITIAVGVVATFMLRAATSTVSVQPEMGSVIPPATTEVSNSASGNSYVKFGPVPTTPPPSGAIWKPAAGVS